MIMTLVIRLRGFIVVKDAFLAGRRHYIAHLYTEPGLRASALPLSTVERSTVTCEKLLR